MCVYFSRDHARTKLSLTPSILQKKALQTTTPAITATKTDGDKTALSNDDFRKMLLGGK